MSDPLADQQRLVALTVPELFGSAGAIKRGHFRIASGHHTSEYWEKAILLQHPQLVDEVARRLADSLRPYSPELVVGPPVGGALLASSVARQLGCRSLFFDKSDDGDIRLARGYRIRPAARIAIVDDIASSGRLLVEMEQELERHGLVPMVDAVIVSRIGGTRGAEVPPGRTPPLIALHEKQSPPNYAPDDCPLCREGALPVAVSALEPPVIG